MGWHFAPTEEIHNSLRATFTPRKEYRTLDLGKDKEQELSSGKPYVCPMSHLRTAGINSYPSLFIKFYGKKYLRGEHLGELLAQFSPDNHCLLSLLSSSSLMFEFFIIMFSLSSAVSLVTQGRNGKILFTELGKG